ncbi:MAG: hypothetical protein EOP06_20425, partial [Proteobacteria bacterium]
VHMTIRGFSKYVALYAILGAVLPWASNAATSHGSCAGLYSSAEIEIVDVPRGPPPALHPFNYRSFITPIGTEHRLLKSLKSFVGGSAFELPGEPCYLSIMDQYDTKDGKVIRAFPWAVAIPRYFRIFRLDDTSVRLIEVEADSTPYAFKLQKMQPARGRYDLNESSIEAEAIALAQSQMTGGRSKGKAYNQGSAPFVMANNEMLKLILAGRSLAISDLSKFNNLITEQGSDAPDLFRGLIRGSRNYVTRGARKYYVDLSETEIKVGNKAFAPASDVERLLSAWVDKVNKIGPESSLGSIIELFREFILIHPFSDGNGRTSRLLLDYMSIRAGFGPVPQDSSFTYNLLTQRNDKTYAQYIRAFQKRRKADLLQR